MQFFKPSDIRTVECVMNNITRNGAGFATAESGDSVFIPVRLVESNNLDVGDMLVAFCVDQSLDENRRDEPVSARYRAIRLRVSQRLTDDGLMEQPKQQPIKAFEPEPEPQPVVPAKPLMTPAILKEKVFAAMRDDERAWSSRDLADHVMFHFASQFELPEDVPQKVSAMLFAEHHAGRVAACAIRKERDQSQPSALYYALTTDTLIDLMENYEVADE